MQLFIFLILLIGSLVWLTFQLQTKPTIISDKGYLCNPNPIFFSGNKSQKRRKHNMLRISKLRRK